MSGDSRIVQGGELDINGAGLEGVVVDAVSKPSGAGGGVASSPIIADFGPAYTLNESVIKFLENSINGGADFSSIDPSKDGGFNVNDLVKNDAITAIVKSLGADFYTLGNLGFSQTQRGKYLTADLTLTPSIPKQSFQKGLAALLGGGETVKYLLTTDIAQALGLDDQTKPVDLNDPQLQQLFPDITQIKSLNGNYVVPADPHIFLLMVNPQYRRFLSACLDESKKVSGAPFNELNREYSTQSLSTYGFPTWRLEKLLQTGFLGLPTVVKTGQQHGVKELKPYLDSLAKLRDDLGKASRL